MGRGAGVWTALGLGLAALCSEARTAAGAVSVAVRAEGRGGYSVEGSFEAAASTGQAWAVLADYEGIPRFVSAMKDRKSTRLNSSHSDRSRMPSSA